MSAQLAQALLRRIKQKLTGQVNAAEEHVFVISMRDAITRDFLDEINEALDAHEAAPQQEPVAWMRMFKVSEDEMDAETIVGRTHPNQLGMPAIAHPDWEPLYAAPQQAQAPGWQLVPVEPTEEMLVAGTEDWMTVRVQEERADAIWAAMLATAPQQGSKK